MSTNIPRLELARHYAESGEYSKATRIAEKELQDNPKSIPWLCLYVYCLEKYGNIAAAYLMCKQLCYLAPNDASPWLNMANIASRLWQTSEAVKAGKKGLKVAHKDKDKVQLNVNLGCVYVDTGRFDKALPYFDAAKAIDPEAQKARSNSGFCYLAKGEWEQGWKEYHYSLGEQWRPVKKYQNPPEDEWDGTPGKKVVLYGEQGIGDQICFASMLPDAAKDNEIILDCAPKLESLFRRSFPEISVYGTLGEEYRPWENKDREFDASLAMGQIGEFYRNSEEDFPKEPFLVADEERVMMWKSLWKTKKKPVIGFAMTGGIQKTGKKYRTSTLEDWLPLFKAIDAHWVSLEYKPRDDYEAFAETHDVDIKEYPWGTLTDDYDDTAALVASLDGVVSVPTSIWHLAGALGVPLVALKFRYSCWKTTAGLPFHPVDHWVEWNRTWKQTVIDSISAVRALTERADEKRLDRARPPAAVELQRDAIFDRETRIEADFSQRTNSGSVANQ